MTTPVCFIHIGAPKTGTTFLQQVAWQNRQLLRQRGLLYPDVNVRGYGHHDLAFLVSGSYPDWAIPQSRPLSELVEDLARETKGHEGPVLLSSENFYLLPKPEGLLDVLSRSGLAATHRLVIVVYLRRQDEAHESWFNQTIKAQGYSHRVEECINSFRDLWDYDLQLSHWEAVFGRENMIVRRYEKQSFIGGGLLRDFLAQIGFFSDDIVLPERRVNPGLNRDLLEFQRLVNGLPLRPMEKRAYWRNLADLSERASGSGLFNESPSIGGVRRRELMAYYAAGNVAVARRHFGCDNLFQPESWVAPPAEAAVELTTEKLTQILAWLKMGEQTTLPESRQHDGQ